MNMGLLTHLPAGCDCARSAQQGADASLVVRVRRSAIGRWTGTCRWASSSLAGPKGLSHHEAGSLVGPSHQLVSGHGRYACPARKHCSWGRLCWITLACFLACPIPAKTPAKQNGLAFLESLAGQSCMGATSCITLVLPKPTCRGRGIWPFWLPHGLAGNRVPASPVQPYGACRVALSCWVHLLHSAHILLDPVAAGGIKLWGSLG